MRLIAREHFCNTLGRFQAEASTFSPWGGHIGGRAAQISLIWTGEGLTGLIGED
jgi:hypothetical protein